jgi:capsular exopolysaccharide synthesis family protein
LPLQENIDATYRQSQVDLSTAQGKLATAVQQLAPLQQKLATMPGIGVRYKEMQQQLDLDTQLYTGLESALSSAKLDEDKTSSNVQVTQGAYTSSIPTSPVRIHDLLIGILASILFSILSLSIIEQFDRKVRTISDLHRIARLPLIGTLPLISRNDLPKLNQPVLPTEIAEALSLTRASLLRYFNAQSGKTLSGTILLTSAASGEGKSIVASELALTLARSGRSVMLIDANLRTPTVNTILDLPQSPGLSNMLLQNKSFDETLVLSEDVPTLSILTSGDIPDCASDLLSSARFAQILRDARYHADFVIIDSPSCSFSDPLLIAPYVDYSIQVVSLGQTAEDAVVATHNALLNAGSPSVGVLVNRTGKNDRQAFRIYGVHEALPSGQQTVSEKNNGSGDGDDKHTLLLSEGHLVDSGAKD